MKQFVCHHESGNASANDRHFRLRNILRKEADPSTIGTLVKKRSVVVEQVDCWKGTCRTLQHQVSTISYHVKWHGPFKGYGKPGNAFHRAILVQRHWQGSKAGSLRD
uniref:Ti plasmid pTi15955 T-DNA region n=1 Tax=Agrobacterium tumefaciens TaxID=358 RepID=Q44389_AGRTU|nr:unnamed protein product [Agrobacterium tumefaciens]